MVSLSVTAPRFSSEQDQEEEKNLTEQEAAEIKDDTYGSHAKLEDPGMRQKLLVEFEMALDNIDDNTKSAYFEARDKAPEAECNDDFKMRFIRCCKSDTVAAASRFCAYWKFRKKLFKDRAFLPFSLDGSGIMSVDDIALLKTRAYVLLPPDEHARAVVFYDKSLLDNVVYERESLVRVLFYIYSVATEEPTMQTAGAVSVVNAQEVRMERFDRKYAKLAVEVESTSPTRINVCHMCYKATRRSILRLLLPFVRHILGKQIRRRLLFHGAAKPGDHVEDLSSYGFRLEHLPESIGGTWSYEAFDEWLEQRIQKDRANSKP